MNAGIRIRLSVMMFLEFFVWGAWTVTLGTYLGGGLQFSGVAIGNAYNATAWAAIISPFFVGMVADRFFPAQQVLGVMHLLGAVLLYIVAGITTPVMFVVGLTAYAICYMPTLALCNSVAFAQLEDTEKQFPAIRVLGTIGWIVAGLGISFVLNPIFKDFNVEATNIPLKMAAIASLVMGVYSFFLPNTPPQAKGQKTTVGDILGVGALRLLKDQSFAVFLGSSLLICIPLAFYYTFTNMFLNEIGFANAAGKMTLGQFSEAFFMIVMPFFFVRLGVKKMLIVGMLAWAVRYACFGFGDVGSYAWMLYIGILLHGVCYDFFFVTGQIYVDNKAPVEIRANAQGLISLVTYGAGMIIGNLIAGPIVDAFATVTTNEAGEEVVTHAWRNIWLIPGAMAVVITILFAIFFKDNGEKAVKAMKAAQAE